MSRITYILSIILVLSSCSVQQKISRSAKQVINDTSLLTAHVGISIYDTETGKYLYNYQGDKYFVPASNTKIPTCYAAMKYLGDSLVGARVLEYRNDLIVLPTGDPTFISEEFTYQPVLQELKQKGNSIIIRFGSWTSHRWGNGWSWNDYEESYMAERSPMPMYGNIVKLFDINDSALTVFGKTDTASYNTFPRMFSKNEFWSKYKYNWSFFTKEYSHEIIDSKNKSREIIKFIGGRDIGNNLFYAKPTYEYQKVQNSLFHF